MVFEKAWDCQIGLSRLFILEEFALLFCHKKTTKAFDTFFVKLFVFDFLIGSY